MKNIDKEQEKRQDRIKSLQQSIKNKEDAVQRRMERGQRQEQIANEAAAENKDSEEEKKREEFMVQKIWGIYLKKKMKAEMESTKEIEVAFQKIRNATGLTDVQDIVQKFLTREQTQSQLLKAVADSEHKIDLLKVENDKQMEVLHEMMINKHRDMEASTKQPEIQKLNDEIQDLQKELESSEERTYKIEIVKDQIYGWTQKVLTKFDQNYESIGVMDFNLDKLEQLKKSTNIDDLLKFISKVVNEQLQKLLREEGSDENKYISSREYINEFASQEYIDKNIRIVPAGKVKDDENRINSGGPSGFMKEDGEEDEENSNKMINLEMEEQRKDIKKQREEMERRQKLEEEKRLKNR